MHCRVYLCLYSITDPEGFRSERNSVMSSLRIFFAVTGGVFLTSASVHADPSAVYIEQVPSSLSSEAPEAGVVVRTNEAEPSDSPLNLDFKLTNTPQPGASGGGNTSTVIQNGNDNSAISNIQGGGNVTRQVQTGSQNDSDVRITNGYDNSVSVEQNGDSHVSTVDLSGTVGQEVIHIQHGSGKVATTKHSGQATSGPIVIDQR